jgi:hypothetical protein
VREPRRHLAERRQFGRLEQLRLRLAECGPGVPVACRREGGASGVRTWSKAPGALREALA